MTLQKDPELWTKKKQNGRNPSTEGVNGESRQGGEGGGVGGYAGGFDGWDEWIDSEWNCSTEDVRPALYSGESEEYIHLSCFGLSVTETPLSLRRMTFT